jgi:hypothetical protein
MGIDSRLLGGTRADADRAATWLWATDGTVPVEIVSIVTDTRVLPVQCLQCVPERRTLGTRKQGVPGIAGLRERSPDRWGRR